MASEATVLAAVRWLRVLQNDSIESAISLLRTLPRYVDLTPTQYQAGLDLLRDLHLLDRGLPLKSAVDLLLADLWKHDDPIWLALSPEAFESLDDLPVDLTTLSGSLELSDEDVWTAMRKFHGKVDALRTAEIGAAGESAFVKFLNDRTRPDVWVNHLSLIDDGAGYDIAISDGAQSAHIEVKSSTWALPFTFHLSRNELRVARDDPSWAIQLLHVDRDRIISMFWVSTKWLIDSAPQNSTRSARWDSFHAAPPADMIDAGLHPNLRWAVDSTDSSGD